MGDSKRIELNFIDQHKAAIITFLLTGIVVLALFSFQLKQKSKLIAESYYELESAEPEEQEIKEEELEKLDELLGETSDKAFNQDQEYKEMMRNFKTVSSNDFERTTTALEEEKLNEEEILQEETSINKSYINSNAYALKSEETE